MASTASIFLGQFNIASVDRISVSITKGGSPWDLSSTGSGVTLVFLDPSKQNSHSVNMIADNATLGKFHYDTLSSPADISSPGYWSLTFIITDTSKSPSIIKTYPYEVSLFAAQEPNYSV
jgi:hypothetical protein